MFSVDANHKITVVASGRVVTPLGNVTVGHDIVTDPAGRPLPAEPADVIQLIICMDSTGQRCEAYQIGTGRKIRIEMNKIFFQDVERNRITIEAVPGSTVKIIDNGPPVKFEAFGPARIDVEEFNFKEAGEELEPINGTKVTLYDTYGWWAGWPDDRSDYPGEMECQQKRPEDWNNVFSKDDLDAEYSIFCIKTAEADLGFLFIVPDAEQKPVAYYVYSHTWVR